MNPVTQEQAFQKHLMEQQNEKLDQIVQLLVKIAKQLEAKEGPRKKAARSVSRTADTPTVGVDEKGE